MKAHEFLNEGQYDHLEPAQQEQQISSIKTLTLDMSAYELSKLMREFRSGTDSYSKAKDHAVVSFYTPEEQENFEAYLKSKNINYNVY